MKIKNNFIVLFIAGCLISLITFSLSTLTEHPMNASPDKFNITTADVLYILFAGFVFAVFMKRLHKSKQI